MGNEKTVKAICGVSDRDFYRKNAEERMKRPMTKEKLALEVIERLKKEYPNAGCTLDYDQAWKLLVSVRLAAQCTDARVNVVVEDLYAKYPDVDALAEADVEDIERIVRPCGLGKSKARDISACMKILKEKYQGKFPRTSMPCSSFRVWGVRAPI